jgi:hypothetical protein
MRLPRNFRAKNVRMAVCLLSLGVAVLSRAQSPYKVDLSASYLGEYALAANTSQSFWMQGGSIELGTNTFRGLGIVAIVSGTHTSSIGSSGIPLSIVIATFGVRYRWHADYKISIYAESLGGEANGFSSIFPSLTGAQTSANGFAAQFGGGVDYKLTPRFALRAVEVSWDRTTLPNASVGVEDNVRVGVGVVYTFGH